jgi:hypothetical protein
MGELVLRRWKEMLVAKFRGAVDGILAGGPIDGRGPGVQSLLRGARA